MKNTSKTLLFFGNERLSTGFVPDGAPTLQALVDNGYLIKAVIAHNNQTNSRAKRELEIETTAKKHGIPVLLPENPVDIANDLAKFQADAAVLVAYGRIIPQPVIDMFPLGIINIHPSLLPRYRGPTPIEQAIREGAKTTGVSLMKLGAGMDNGPVYAQQTVSLTNHETKHGLTSRLQKAGRDLLIQHLPAILNGSLTPQAQDNSQATYTSLLAKQDGMLDLTKPADMLEREVRAFGAWPKSRLKLNGATIIVTKTKVARNKTDGGLIVECGKGTFLEIEELIAPNGKKMSGAAYLRGHAH